MWDAFIYMVGQLYISSVGAMLLLVATISFVSSKIQSVPEKKSSDRSCACFGPFGWSFSSYMLLMKLDVETCIRHNLLATSGNIFFYFNCWYNQNVSQLTYYNLFYSFILFHSSTSWVSVSLNVGIIDGRNLVSGYHTLYQWYRLWKVNIFQTN